MGVDNALFLSVSHLNVAFHLKSVVSTRLQVHSRFFISCFWYLLGIKNLFQSFVGYGGKRMANNPFTIIYMFQFYCYIPPPKFNASNVLLSKQMVVIFAVDIMKPGNTVTLRNAKIDMFKGSMRLAVDKWGRIEVAEPANFDVKEDNNLSLVEYELVNVEE